MKRPAVPPEVLDAAHARRAARAAGDWAEADRLRGVIEAAGWRIVDRGVDFSLAPAHPPDVTHAGRTRYGASSGVPSRLAEPSTVPATLLLRAADDPIERAAAAARLAVPGELQVVVVADDPGPEVAAEAERLEATTDPGFEVTWTSARLGPGASLNIGLRRARGAIILVLGPGVVPHGDLLAPLGSALASEETAVAGARGLTGRDVRSLAPVGSGEVAALDGQVIGTRRELAGARGPVDEGFHHWSSLARWWSLRLRDAGEDRPPLRAVAIDGLPVRAVDERAEHGEPPDRLARRDHYRLLERYGARPDLFSAGRPG